MKFYIENSSNIGDLILDPFIGAGPSCVAAKELKRDYIGFELDEKYFNISKNRLRD